MGFSATLVFVVDAGKLRAGGVMHPLIMLVALLACGDKEDSGGATTTLPTATGTPVEADTGVAWLFWYAEVNVSEGALVDGRYGLQARYVPDAFSAPDIAGSVAVCGALSPMTVVDPAVATCAGCDWQFQVVLGASVVEGEGCGEIPGFSSVNFEGETWGFGYQASYDTYSSVVMMYDPTYAAYGWWPFFAAAPSGGNMVTGDASGVEGFRAIYNYYYYAPYYYVVSRP